MKNAWYVLAVLLFILAGCSPKETPIPTFSPPPVQVIPTATPMPTLVPTATPTISPYPVVLEMQYANCAEQWIYFGQPMMIQRYFPFGSSYAANSFKNTGLVVVTIDGAAVKVKDPDLWSNIVPRHTVNGTYYDTTFKVNLPHLAVGSHSIKVEYSIPSYLYTDCATLKVLPR